MKLIKLWEADLEKAYALQCTFLPEENGFINTTFNYSLYEYEQYVEDRHNRSLGHNIPDGFVPDTVYILVDNEKYVGLFNFRHYLNDYLKNGSGHIGYGISKKYRGQGYATKGLKLLIDEVKDIIQEDEIYLSVYKSNIDSLKVQQNNGAYIHHEDDEHYYTRIKK